MNLEEYLVHSIRGLLVLGTVLISIGVWKYLEKKAPGMVTLYDLMIKDMIFIVNLKQLAGQLAMFKFWAEYPKELALTLVYFDFATIWTFFLQIFVTVGIR